MAGLMAKGPLLVRERKKLGLTQLQAAVAIGISPQTLARAESGLGIQPKTLSEIAEFYGLEPSAVSAA